MKKPEKNKLAVWYLGLNQREQRLLITGIFMISFAFLWVLVYLPVVTHIDGQVKVKNRMQDQLMEMRSATSSVTDMGVASVVPIPTNMTFSSWVDQQLRMVNLQEMVNRSEPISEDSLSVWLQGAPFDQVIDWIQVMSAKYAVQVDQIDVNVVDSSLGLTNIRMRIVK